MNPQTQKLIDEGLVSVSKVYTAYTHGRLKMNAPVDVVAPITDENGILLDVSDIPLASLNEMHDSALTHALRRAMSSIEHASHEDVSAFNSSI